MEQHAWLVNVARGRHVVTDDLVWALRKGVIGGAGLDVTDPEPLPDDHPLWSLPNCIITPHVGNTPEMAVPLLSERIATNVGAPPRARSWSARSTPTSATEGGWCLAAGDRGPRRSRRRRARRTARRRRSSACAAALILGASTADEVARADRALAGEDATALGRLAAAGLVVEAEAGASTCSDGVPARSPAGRAAVRRAEGPSVDPADIPAGESRCCGPSSVTAGCSRSRRPLKRLVVLDWLARTSTRPPLQRADDQPGPRQAPSRHGGAASLPGRRGVPRS